MNQYCSQKEEKRQIYVPIKVCRFSRKEKGEWGEAAALVEEKSQQFGYNYILDLFVDQINHYHRFE